MGLVYLMFCGEFLILIRTARKKRVKNHKIKFS